MAGEGHLLPAEHDSTTDENAPIAAIRMCSIEPPSSFLKEVRPGPARCENQPFTH